MSTFWVTVLQVMPMNVSRRELVWCVVFLIALLDLAMNCRQYVGGIWGGRIFLWTIPFMVVWAFMFIRTIELRWLRLSLLVLYFIVIVSAIVFPTLRFFGIFNTCS